MFHMIDGKKEILNAYLVVILQFQPDVAWQTNAFTGTWHILFLCQSCRVAGQESFETQTFITVI